MWKQSAVHPIGYRASTTGDTVQCMEWIVGVSSGWTYAELHDFALCDEQHVFILKLLFQFAHQSVLQLLPFLVLSEGHKHDSRILGGGDLVFSRRDNAQIPQMRLQVLGRGLQIHQQLTDLRLQSSRLLLGRILKFRSNDQVQTRLREVHFLSAALRPLVASPFAALSRRDLLLLFTRILFLGLGLVAALLALLPALILLFAPFLLLFAATLLLLASSTVVARHPFDCGSI